MRIKKKTWPEYFQAILDNRKNFELRLADFDIKEGDILVLREWDPKKKEYTGRELEKEVSYILKTKNIKFHSKKAIDKYGYQIISLK